MAAPGDSPALSVLIPTMVHREEKFLSLVHGLLAQAEASPAPVEVVALQNPGNQTLAAYRQALLHNARGLYLSYVDDDDQVPGYYVEEIIKAIQQEPDAVTFEQECTGMDATVTHISLQYENPPLGVIGGAYIRSFTHTCPVRTEMARKGTFYGAGAGWTGEDMDYVYSLLPLLRERGSREVHIDRVMYRYCWSAADTTQHGPRPRALVIRDMEHRRPVISSPCFRWCQ